MFGQCPVDRIDSPNMKINFDFVNHMNAERIFESARYIQCAVATLGDRIGVFHVKDVDTTEGKLNVLHIDETLMGTGVMDVEAMIKVSSQIEPWKLFTLEHINNINDIKIAFDHVQHVANSIGHTWTDLHCTRERWEKGLCK